jgi:hypothetical protein
MRRLSAHLAFDDYIKLTRRFDFLVALGLPGSGTEAFTELEYIQFQCNCSIVLATECMPTLSAVRYVSQEVIRRFYTQASGNQQEIASPHRG